jgi:hypothetical protein
LICIKAESPNPGPSLPLMVVAALSGAAMQKIVNTIIETPARAAAARLHSLAGKKSLITGIANDHSIAYAVAAVIREAGAELALTYQNDKTATYTRPLAERLGAKLFVKLDVTEPKAIESVADAGAHIIA